VLGDRTETRAVTGVAEETYTHVSLWLIEFHLNLNAQYTFW
jgi:hypothetical protein